MFNQQNKSYWNNKDNYFKLLNTYTFFYHRGYLYAKLGWCASTGQLLMLDFGCKSTSLF